MMSTEKYATDNYMSCSVDVLHLDLDMLLAIEPDVIQADELADRYDLEPLPFDSIEIGEIEARNFIRQLITDGRHDRETALRRFNRRVISEAIRSCHHAHTAAERAATLRREADIAASRNMMGRQFLAHVATTAERDAAVWTIAAVAAAHRARGVDAVISLAVQGQAMPCCFGLIDFV